MIIHSPSYFVIESLRLLHMDFRLLGKEEAEAIRSQVLAKYTSYYGPVMWHYLLERASIQDEEGWMRIDEFVEGTSFIVFFDEKRDKSMIEFPTGVSFIAVMEECPGFEFYITNRETTYLICFNDHDYLIGAGDAKEWVARYADEKEAERGWEQSDGTDYQPPIK